MADGEFQAGAGRELEGIGAIHQYFAFDAAAFGDGGLRGIPRCGKRNHLTEGNGLDIGAGGGIRSTGRLCAAMRGVLGSAGLRTPNLM